MKHWHAGRQFTGWKHKCSTLAFISLSSQAAFQWLACGTVYWPVWQHVHISSKNIRALGSGGDSVQNKTAWVCPLHVPTLNPQPQMGTDDYLSLQPFATSETSVSTLLELQSHTTCLTSLNQGICISATVDQNERETSRLQKTVLLWHPSVPVAALLNECLGLAHGNWGLHCSYYNCLAVSFSRNNSPSYDHFFLQFINGPFFAQV